MDWFKLTSCSDLHLNMSKACRTSRSHRPRLPAEYSFDMIYASETGSDLEGAVIRHGNALLKTVLTRTCCIHQVRRKRKSKS